MRDFGKSILFVICLAMSGCGESQQGMTASVSSVESYSANEYPTEAEGTADSVTVANKITGAVSGANADTSQVRFAAAANRKIIYNTSIGLVVSNYADFESRIPRLVAQHGGFIANNQTRRTYQDQQSGTWTIRVPIDQYSEFLDGVSALGFAENRNENAQDVTEEFVDVEARIKTKKQLEQRVLAILDDRAGKLAEILEVERELSRVREEIERMEGRRRYLADRTSLATVTINCREEQEYEPATAPSLGARISQAWRVSIGTMQFVGSNLLVAGIAFFPWLVLLSLAGWILFRIGKRLRSALAFQRAV